MTQPPESGNAQSSAGDLHARVAALLIDLEAVLRQLQVWHDQPPAAEAFDSTEPFCVDTMDFDQWLQFVFLERMQALVDQRMPLPGECGIAPMAEVFWKEQPKLAAPIIKALMAIDEVLSEPR